MTNFTLDVYDADLDDLAALSLAAPVHSGRVEKAEFGSEGQITVTVSSIFRMAERQVPAMRLQRTCNWRTFDGIGCQAIEASFTTTGTITAVSSVSPPYVEAVEFGTKSTAEGDPNWFALGKVTCGNETRLCTGASGNRLYLNFPFVNALVGQAISAVAGDDKRVTTCNSKFGQLVNHSGSPYTPNENPQKGNLIQPMPTGGKK